MDLFTNPKNAFDYDQGRASVTLAGGSYDSVKERTDRETQSSSKLNVSEDLTVNSGKNITVAGSEINAGGDVTLTAAENVSIKTTEEKTSHTAEETHGSVEFSVGGKNAATDVAYATKALVEAKEAVVKAKNDYEKYRESLKKAEDDHKNNLIDQDDLDSIREQEAFYIANIALCGENVVAKTAALLQSAAGAAGSAETFGFSGDAQFEIDATKTKSTSESTTAKASTIKTGGSFTVTAGSKAEVKGSSVAAGEDITLDAENVEISAAENRESSSEDKKHANMKVSFGTSGAIGVNASADSTETDSESKTYTNAHLSGNNIKIKSSEDTTVIGGVVKAKNELDLDVNGSLVVQSLQDKSKNSSQTIGASGGVSVTGENVSGNAGVNANFSTGKKSWVTEQTSLTGGTVNVDVEDKTTLKGAVIASTTDNLTLTTGSLEFSNIKDKDVSFNAGGSAGGSFKPTENTYSSSLNYGYTDNRQTNLATIGAGTITITKPETSEEGLNRDVTISQYNTYSGGLKGGVTVDTATVELINDREKTLNNTVDALKDGLKEADKTADKIDKEIETTIEKTENLLKFDHYTENKNVSSYQTMDEYEKKVENGKPVSAQEKLDYYELKKAVGEPLTDEEQCDKKNAIKERTKEVANNLKQDILDTYTKDGALVINAKIALLEKLDPDAAYAIKVRFAEERAEIAYAKQLAVNSSLRDAEIQQGNEIANNVVNLSGTVNTMGIDNTDSNSPDAKLLRIVKDKLTENSIESIADAGNSDSTLKQAFNLALGVVFKEAADNIPEHISVADVGLSEAAGNVFGKVEKQIVNETEDAANLVERNLPFKDSDRLTEINKTLDRIEQGDNFCYKKDGTLFRNDKKKLPADGDYREYTVNTPGASNRGTRRILVDQNSGNTYYTDDHYENFIQINPKKK